MKQLFPYDKVLHFIVGVFLYFLLSLMLTPIIALFISGLIGLLKELIYDKLMGKGKFELLDLVYHLAGSFIMFIA